MGVREDGLLKTEYGLGRRRGCWGVRMDASRLGWFEPLWILQQNTFDITPYKVQAPLSFFLSSPHPAFFPPPRHATLRSRSGAESYISFPHTRAPVAEIVLQICHTCKRAAFPGT
jgi:hypothetical protein